MWYNFNGYQFMTVIQRLDNFVFIRSDILFFLNETLTESVVIDLILIVY